MKHLLILFLLALSLTACGKDNGKPWIQFITKPKDDGYKHFIVSCTNNVKDEKVCHCQADMLKKYMPDDKIGLVAEASDATAKNDNAKLSQLKTEHPDLVDLLKRLSFQGEHCASAQ